MANEFQIKDDEMLFFIDYNKTLVNYDNLDFRPQLMDHYSFDETKPIVSKLYLTKSLFDFQKKTGLKPVICIVSNASINLTDNLGDPRLLSDFYNIFIKNGSMTNENSSLRFFKYIMCRENDGFFKICPNGNAEGSVYEWVEFSDEIKKIRKMEDFHKFESLERILCVVDPAKRSKNIFFAGNDIKDDYPMKFVQTPEGVCKIFVRPGNRRKITPTIKQRFCEAKGYEFTSVNKHGRKIKNIDDFSIKYLNENDRKALENFDDGDYVILTQPNSNGLIEGIRKATEIVAENMKKSGYFPE